MLLSIKERLVMNMIMEQQSGRYDALKLIRKFREDLSFSEDEIKEINLRSEDGVGFRWDKEIQKDIPIGDVVVGMIKKQFQKLDKEERLMEDHLEIYQKFVVEKDKSKEN